MSDQKNKAELHHIGVAVKAIEPVKKCLEAATGVSFEESEDVTKQGVRVTFAEFANGSKIELVQATQDHSPQFAMLPHPIRSFVEKHGVGLHHLAIKVSDIDESIARVRAEGVRTLTDQPESGALGRRAIFLNPLDCQGLLLELFEEK